MKAVVAGYGSTGDTLPLIALAAGLRDAGHEVVLLADEAAGTTARRLGLDFRELAGSARAVVTEAHTGGAGPSRPVGLRPGWFPISDGSTRVPGWRRSARRGRVPT